MPCELHKPDDSSPIQNASGTGQDRRQDLAKLEDRTSPECIRIDVEALSCFHEPDIKLLSNECVDIAAPSGSSGSESQKEVICLRPNDAECREYIVSNAIPKKPPRTVRRIFHPFQTALARIGFDLVATNSEQRATHVARSGESRESSRARITQRPHQNRLDLIVGVVGGYEVPVGSLGDLPQKRPTSGAHYGFRRAIQGFSPELTRDAQHSGPRTNEIRRPRCSTPGSVIECRDDDSVSRELRRGGVEKNHGIDTAGDRKHNSSTLAKSFANLRQNARHDGSHWQKL